MSKEPMYIQLRNADQTDMDLPYTAGSVSEDLFYPLPIVFPEFSKTNY